MKTFRRSSIQLVSVSALQYCRVYSFRSFNGNQQYNGAFKAAATLGAPNCWHTLRGSKNISWVNRNVLTFAVMSKSNYGPSTIWTDAVCLDLWRLSTPYPKKIPFERLCDCNMQKSSTRQYSITPICEEMWLKYAKVKHKSTTPASDEIRLKYAKFSSQAQVSNSYLW